MRQWGLILRLNKNGFCFHSPIDMHVGTELPMRIYLPRETDFDDLQVLARTVGKDLSSEQEWEVYQYQLEFIEISEEDRLKLKQLK